MKNKIELGVKKYLNEIFNNILKDYTSFNLSDDDLKAIAVWGLQGDYSTSGCWDEGESFEDAVNCAINDFKNFLNKAYPKELGNMPNPATIYRFVTLKNENQLNKSDLGISWFSDLERPKDRGFFDMLDYLTKNRPQNEGLYLLTGQTEIRNIDIANTLWQRTTQWQENEIVIKDPSHVKLVNIMLYEKARMG